MTQLVISPEVTEKNIKNLFKILEMFPDRKDVLVNMYNDLIEDGRILNSPASSLGQLHHACPGGYLDHVMRVVKFSAQYYNLFQLQGHDLNDFTKEELYFAALHHDLGKLAPLEIPQYYVEEESDWHRKNQNRYYKRNPKNPKYSVYDLTIYMLNYYGVKYSLNEMLGIRLTDGLYEKSNEYYLLTFDAHDKLRSTLPMILHQADLNATYFEMRLWAKKNKVF